MENQAPKHESNRDERYLITPLNSGIFLVVLLMLAVDDLNPAKILSSCTAGWWTTRHIAWTSVLALIVLCINQAQFIFYFLVKLFFRATINNIFFRSVEIIGAENLPELGPVILTGNHNNQFVDGAILLTNCHRKISFMIAEKSWNRPLIGPLARAFHSIPVSRPQDTVKPGTGAIILNGTKTVRGKATSFASEAHPGSQIMVSVLDQETALKVHEVISDTELTLSAEGPMMDGECKFKIMPKVDQSSMYDAVFQCLDEGKCLGIFPEGGSHDRTDLLPLKAGVAIIALDAYKKHHLRVPIVPVGLNYFRGHHFRGRVVVEFGAPIHIDDSLYEMNETNKRGATEALLKIVTTGMRSAIVPVPDYRTLQFIYMVRRLYQPDGLKLGNLGTMDLNRRFAEGIRRIAPGLLQAVDASEEGEDDTGSLKSLSINEDDAALPAKSTEEMSEFYRRMDELRSDLLAYMVTLKQLGLRDHQIMQIQWWGIDHLVGRVLYVTLMLGLGAIPQLMFNLPVGLVARAWASTEQKKALKASSVKLAARDVLMSYKIIYCLMLVPILYFFYIAFLLFFVGLNRATVLLTLASPVFSFFGVKASEQGFRAYSDIVPLAMRLNPASRSEQNKLPARRAALQLRVRRAVRSAGPLLGDLYTAETVDWQKEIPSDTRWSAEVTAMLNEPDRASFGGGTPKSSSGMSRENSFCIDRKKSR